ncbi:hypothetical protein CK203_080795 [Vitis vinifera]|uniref:Uncharacterized protein n=1 Tax=Vitis vinifera TaxID=29760 RepID=A0A438F846_VITVI|nr:hypothetical protein CK203_080795 [Vitis vinifera]
MITSWLWSAMQPEISGTCRNGGNQSQQQSKPVLSKAKAMSRRKGSFKPKAKGDCLVVASLKPPCLGLQEVTFIYPIWPDGLSDPSDRL